jgi:DNA-binding CsgD family transcriptional regulator
MATDTQNGPVGSLLARERVRRDVDVLSRAGLDTGSFLSETYASLQRAIPVDAGCVATLDPATHLATGAFKFGALAHREDTDELWGQLEYRHVESTSYTQLCRDHVPSIGMGIVTDGHFGRSKRFDELVSEALGCADELRIIAFDGSQLWGGMALFHGGHAARYSPDTVCFAGSLSSALARGLRVGVLASIAQQDQDPVPGTGPGVLIFNADGRLDEATPGAADWLSQRLASGGTISSPVVQSLVAAAWSYAQGRSDRLPAARIRLAGGMWIALHAAPLSSGEGVATRVVLTVGEARPPDIVPLLAAAFDLTPREREVVTLILQGSDSRAIASTLHLSTHTVHDHVKAIFDKTGVHSRRELLAQVFFDQYVPRMGKPPAVDGSISS